MSRLRLSPETIILFTLLAMSLLALAFMGKLVAEPKVLFGRSLTAIEPNLFPTMMIAALAAISALVLLLSLLGKNAAAESAIAQRTQIDWKGVRRAVLLFACMLFLALSMVPFGFLISTCITMVMISVLAGNRSLWQIGLLATVCPVLLYLTATRVLAVSLPELNAVELFYSRILGL